MRRHALVLTALLVVVGCSDGRSDDQADASTTTSVAPATSQVVESTVVDSTVPSTLPSTLPSTTAGPTTVVEQAFADRPYDVFVPGRYDAATPTPLVILLHGYGVSGDIQNLYLRLQPQAEARGFLYVHPDGTPNALGQKAWNATDACCDSTESIDDSAYITSIIDYVSATYNVDPARVYLVGHSNGGFMSYRMACDHADRIAAIVSLAGATFLDASQCAPSEPVSVLQIHGTADGTIRYEGGSTPLGEYPSASETVSDWAIYNGCTTTTEPHGTADLGAILDGDETTKEAFTSCPVDGDVELWTIADGPHIPQFTDNFAVDIIDWLYAHPKV